MSSSTTKNEGSEPIWGRLLSECSSLPHVNLSGSTFSVGDLFVDYEDIPQIICQLTPIKDASGVSSLFLEVFLRAVQVNSYTYGKCCVTIEHGDELTFVPFKSKYAYIYQKPNPESQRKREFLKELEREFLVPNFSFSDFKYLSDKTKDMLIASTYINLKSSYIAEQHDLLPCMRRILLSGPPGTEIYLENLVKALANHYEAKLLTIKSFSPPVNVVRASRKSSKVFAAGDRVICTYWGWNETAQERRVFTKLLVEGTVCLVFEHNESSKVGVRMDNYFEEGTDLGGICEEGHGLFFSAECLHRCARQCVPRSQTKDRHLNLNLQGGHNSKTLVEEIFEVAFSAARSGPIIVFIKNIDEAEHKQLEKIFLNMPMNMVVIASNIVVETDAGLESQESTANQYGSKKAHLFPNMVRIWPPQEKILLNDWKQRLQHESHALRAQYNVSRIRSVLNRSTLHCPNLETLGIEDQSLTTPNIERIIGWAMNYVAMNSPDLEDVLKSSILSLQSIKYGLDMLQGTESETNNLEKLLKDLVLENGFEHQLLGDVILASDIGVKFDDIGALDNVKEALKELVMLPLQRPELCTKGLLTKPCKGILLFGPPGTGKTMLAKALATESGANFINVSLSSLTLKWHGESEKMVKALFTLASKLSPAIIFIDEADSLFSREHGTDQLYSKLAKEFQIMWDGMKTKEKERVMVVAATNNPFDIQDAIISRLPRRFLVGLPDDQNREKILRAILAKEDVEPDLDFGGIAKRTVGYSGSDLKNLCVAAANCRIRELLNKEKERKLGLNEIRPLKMDDFLYACTQVRASVSNMDKLLQWNATYGEGGTGCSGRKDCLSYFI